MKEAVLYLIFGLLTTAVNFVSFNILDAVLHHTTASTALAWFISVLFAYVTNKNYVFNQGEQAARLGQFFSFVRFRLLSGLIDLIIMFIFVDLLFFNKQIIKLLSNVVVVILNYFFSKLFIFKKPVGKQPSEGGERIE